MAGMNEQSVLLSVCVHVAWNWFGHSLVCGGSFMSPFTWFVWFCVSGIQVHFMCVFDVISAWAHVNETWIFLHFLGWNATLFLLKFDCNFLLIKGMLADKQNLGLEGLKSLSYLIRKSSLGGKCKWILWARLLVPCPRWLTSASEEVPWRLRSYCFWREMMKRGFANLCMVLSDLWLL